MGDRVTVLAGATGRLGGLIARSLRDRGARVRAIVRPGTAPGKTLQLREFGVAIAEADYGDAAQLARACEGGSCVVSALAGLRDVIVDAQTQLLEAAVAAGVPRFIPSDFAIDYDRTTLVEFVVADGAPITVFVVQRSGVAARVLPPFDSLGAAVRRFTALVEGGVDAAPFGRRLAAALVDPALALLRPGATRLIVVPDGPLHRLPFDALRSTNGRFLVERYALGTAPSASTLLTLWSRPRVAPPGPVRLLALGDAAVAAMPRDTADAAAADFFAAARAAGALERLAGAAREARLVARYVPAADVRLGRDASATFLKHTDLRGYRVVHFATHAVVDERSVAGTALALAPGDGESGFVGASDLSALRLAADLAVLSACRSAADVVVGGEGIRGLTAPLLAAGARSLVATQWRIDDREVVPVVDAFYAALANVSR